MDINHYQPHKYSPVKQSKPGRKIIASRSKYPPAILVRYMSTTVQQSVLTT
jgi:hypothetical protein